MKLHLSDFLSTFLFCTFREKKNVFVLYILLYILCLKWFLDVIVLYGLVFHLYHRCWVSQQNISLFPCLN